MSIFDLFLLASLALTAASVPIKNDKADCTPSDGWRLLALFDNLDGDSAIDVTYRGSIGTKFASGISPSEQEAIFQAFADELGRFSLCSSAYCSNYSNDIVFGTSSETFFNWNILSEEEMGPLIQKEFSASVPAGKQFQVKQVVGRCGGTSVNTQRFSTILS